MRSPAPHWFAALLVLTTAAGQVAHAGPVLAIRDGDAYGFVSVGNPPAYAYSGVDMTGGSVHGITAYDAAVVALAGGMVTTGGSGEVAMFDRSRLEMTGGRIVGGFYVRDQAIANVRGGDVGDVVRAFGRGQLNFYGIIPAPDITLLDQSKINVFNGG